jgi:hypothetical protein
MKYVILDSGPLISLTLNGLLDIFEKLKTKYKEIQFIITPAVKHEVIDHAMNVKKYELEGLKLTDLINRKVFTLSTELVSNNVLEKETQRIMKIANDVIRVSGKSVELIQIGEASCLAFSNLCNCKSIIAIDERTTRLLSESPENLQKIMERKLHMQLNLNKKLLKEFKDFKFIRSAELLYVAFKNNLIGLKNDKALLDALLYAVKFTGTAISSKEIEEMKNLI